jgi:hypothetical protein
MCIQNGVVFEMETHRPFAGKIYAKNEYHKQACRSSFAEKTREIDSTSLLNNGGNGGSFKLNFNECGMIRERMVGR